MRKMRMDNVPDMLRAAGVPNPLLGMAQQYVFFLPRTCDPYAQGVMLLVEAIQNVLASKGAPLVPDGGLGEETARYIRIVSGPGWVDKTWVKLLGEALAAPPFEKPRLSPALTHPVPVGGFLDDLFASPLPLLAGAAAVYWFFIRKSEGRTERRGRVRGYVGRAVSAAGQRIGGTP